MSIVIGSEIVTGNGKTSEYEKLVRDLDRLPGFAVRADVLLQEYRYIRYLNGTNDLVDYGRNLGNLLISLVSEFENVSASEDVLKQVRNAEYYACVFSTPSEIGLNKGNIIAYLESLSKGLRELSGARYVLGSTENTSETHKNEERQHHQSNLSEKQINVLQKLSEGLTTADIASAFGSSSVTGVKYQIGQLYEKLGTEITDLTRDALVEWYNKHKPLLPGKKLRKTSHMK